MYNINQVCDYVIFRLKSHDEASFLDNLKLQKLLYYIQAWHLAFNGEKLFEGKFQAWIHGPVNRTIFDRFKDTKSIYTEMEFSDIQDITSIDKLSEQAKSHIDNIIQHYSVLSGSQLEKMTHGEEPWISARKGYTAHQRCEVEISESLMLEYYKKRLTA